MNRRESLVVLIALVSASVTGRRTLAQPTGKTWRIGILNPRPRLGPGERDNYVDFIEGLRELGYVEGRHFILHWKFADNALERLPSLATELVDQRVDLIVTTGTPAVRAAQQATNVIPIVALLVGDPVRSGFAVSLARPGGNITGLTTYGSDVAVKRLEILAAIAPGAERIGYLMNPDNSFIAAELPMLEAAARRAGKELVPVDARSAEQLGGAFDLLARKRGAALLVADDSVLRYHRARIGTLAVRHRLPVVLPWTSGAENALAVYSGVHREAIGRRVAAIVDKIFKGAKAGDLPFDQPTKFDLVINRKIAKALGIVVPQTVLLQATRVIE